MSDLQEGDVGFPMDGQSLSSLLHKRGINIRYLGKIADTANKPEPRLEALKSLVLQEMVARAFKHIANRHLRYLPSPFAASCISHLLNCLLGTRLNENPKSITDESLKLMYPEAKFSYEDVSPASLNQEIESQISLRYRYTVEGSCLENMKAPQLLREVSLKLGLQLVAREYAFDKITPSEVKGVNGHSQVSQGPSTNGYASVSGGKKKKRVAEQPVMNSMSSSLPPSPPQTFQPDDILNVVPILKDASPRSVLAEEALEAGRISVAQGQKELGQELLLESLSLHEQIYGILHPEVARVYYQLSTLFYGLDDKNIAVELARKAVIVAERTLGVDSNETILSYLNLGLFEHAVGNTRLALTYVRHALDLWKVVYGIHHPDSITTVNNAAVMLQHLKLYHDSRLWFEASLSICQKLSGKGSVNTATLLFQLAQALALDQDSKGAVNRMREAYNIFNNELGPTDRNTKEAETWLEQLTQNAVSIAKHAKDVQARRLRRVTQLTPRITLETRPQPMAGQNGKETANSQRIASRTESNSRLHEKSVDELLRYIEGSPSAKQTTPKKTANPKRRQPHA